MPGDIVHFKLQIVAVLAVKPNGFVTRLYRSPEYSIHGSKEQHIDAYEALVRGVNGEGAASMLKWATATVNAA